MSDLYNNIKEACLEKGITPSAMCLELGMSKSTMSDLKCGRKKTLSSDKLAKIANFLEVSTDRLMYGKTEMSTKEALPLLTPKDERDIAKQLDKMLSSLGSPDEALMFDGEPLDAETRDLLEISLRNQLELAKRLAKQKFTPKKYRK